MAADSNWANYGTPAANNRSATKVIVGDYSRKFTPNAVNEGIQSDPFTTVITDRMYCTFKVYPDDGTVVSMILMSGDGVTVLLAKTFTGLTEDAWNTLDFSISERVAGSGAFLVIHSGEQTSGDFYVGDVFGSKVGGQGQFLARRATGARITIDSNDIRWAVGGTIPTMAATTKLGHLIVDPAEIILDNFDSLKTFKYVSNVSQSAGILNVTPEF